jgi:hypothetical protein
MRCITAGPSRKDFLLRRLLVVPALAIVALTAVAALGCAPAPTPTGSAQPGHPLGALVNQSDGRFGYEMLRPAGWAAVEAAPGRGYLDARSLQDARLGLVVTNLAVAARSVADPQGELPQWEAFRRDPTLDGWTSGIERMWRSNGIDYQTLKATSTAKVYLTSYGANRELQVVAFVVRSGQPLVVGLQGTASHPLLDRSQLSASLLGDFMTIVDSLKAIPVDPNNVAPSLP